MIVSTGGALLEDVQRAYDTIMPINPQLAILQCTAGYPAAFEELDLRVIATYRERFPGAVIGFSSHDNGIAMPVAAYMLGARIVEKHFTLNRAMKGTDHAFSLEPVGLRKMVRDLERTYKAMGDGSKKIYDSEKAPIVKMGKSLVVARDLPSGHVLGAGRHRHEVARRRHPAVRARQGARPGDAQAAARGRLPVVRGAEQAERRARAFVTEHASASTTRSPSSPAPAASWARSGSRRCSKPARAWRRSICRRRRPSPAFEALAASVRATALQRFDCDITRPRVDRSARRGLVGERLGEPSILVNNAGIDQPPDSPGGRHQLRRAARSTQFRRMVEVNLLGTFQVTQVFGERDGGARRRARSSTSARSTRRCRPIRTSTITWPATRRSSSRPPTARRRRRSSTCRSSSPRTGPARGVRVNTLSPGGVLAGQDEQFKAKYGARVPLAPHGAGRGPEGPARVPRVAGLVVRHRPRAAGGRRVHRLVSSDAVLAFGVAGADLSRPR